MPFHNRAYELADLRRILASRRPELIIIYGRRGVGKSALVAEAFAATPHLFYQATTRALPHQLEDLTAALASYAPELVVSGRLTSFDAFLSAVGQIARLRSTEPVVLVLDELPYLAQVDPSIPTELQRWWDGVRQAGLPNLKVFLLGSLVSWMEEHTLSERGPLHNRRTGQLHLESMGYEEAALFYPGYTATDRISAYAIWGGLPSYLTEIDPDLDVWTNVLERVLNPVSRLADEPMWLRFSDLRAEASYSSALRAIAGGFHRPSEIAKAIGKTRADEVMYTLDQLCQLRLVRRVVPIHELNARHTRHSLYQVEDHYVAFWYRFVDRLRHMLATRRFADALSQIRQGFDKYVSERAFEDVCRQYVASGRVLTEQGEMLDHDAVGSWWTGDAERMDELDVVAARDGHAVLVGECKWSSGPCDARDLHGLDAALRKAASDIDPVARPYRALFSRAGFDPELLALASDPAERVLLVSPEGLYS
jgi:uncharacterized protein